MPHTPARPGSRERVDRVRRRRPPRAPTRARRGRPRRARDRRRPRSAPPGHVPCRAPPGQPSGRRRSARARASASCGEREIELLELTGVGEAELQRTASVMERRLRPAEDSRRPAQHCHSPRARFTAPPTRPQWKREACAACSISSSCAGVRDPRPSSDQAWLNSATASARSVPASSGIASSLATGYRSVPTSTRRVFGPSNSQKKTALVCPEREPPVHERDHDRARRQRRSRVRPRIDVALLAGAPRASRRRRSARTPSRDRVPTAGSSPSFTITPAVVCGT